MLSDLPENHKEMSSQILEVCREKNTQHLRWKKAVCMQAAFIDYKVNWSLSTEFPTGFGLHSKQVNCSYTTKTKQGTSIWASVENEGDTAGNQRSV